jgi:hypothetical protein
MADQNCCRAGDWVEVEFVLLEPADRSKSLPEDTAAQPLRVWVKGFAQSDAEAGQELTVETMTGRRVTGRFTEANPGYFHTFGRPIPELVHVGRDLRAQLAAYRAAELSVSGAGGDPAAAGPAPGTAESATGPAGGGGGCGCGCGAEGGAS